MIPEAVRQQWAVKLERLAATHGDLELPHASVTTLALLGASNDPAIVEGIRLLLRRQPEEPPLDGGVAACRTLDEVLYATIASSTGRRPRGNRALSAVWIATDEALYYAVPHAGLLLRWPWADVTLQLRKRGRRFAQVDAHILDDVFQLRLGANASDNLLAISEWRRAAGNDSQDQG